MVLALASDKRGGRERRLPSFPKFLVLVILSFREAKANVVGELDVVERQLSRWCLRARLRSDYLLIEESGRYEVQVFELEICSSSNSG
jgi:hypothetical protein